MGAYLVKAAVLCDSAVFSNIVVITYVEEASCQVVVLELLRGVVLGLAGGGTVEDEITDGGFWHEDAVLDLCEEVVLGGYGGAGESHGKFFCYHNFFLEQQFPAI